MREGSIARAAAWAAVMRSRLANISCVILQAVASGASALAIRKLPTAAVGTSAVWPSSVSAGIVAAR